MLKRIRTLVPAGRIRFTRKAHLELNALGVDKQDAGEALGCLRPSDFVRRVPSAQTGEWLYIFKPTLLGQSIYAKCLLRDGLVVVLSFHDDDEEDSQEDVV